jgi:hypothetical protein
MTTPRCGQYCFRKFLCVLSEFSFSHVLVQTAAWNLIKIAHKVYLIILLRWKNPVSFSTNFQANIDLGSNISSRSLNSIVGKRPFIDRMNLPRTGIIPSEIRIICADQGWWSISTSKSPQTKGKMQNWWAAINFRIMTAMLKTNPLDCSTNFWGSKIKFGKIGPSKYCFWIKCWRREKYWFRQQRLMIGKGIF